MFKEVAPCLAAMPETKPVSRVAKSAKDDGKPVKDDSSSPGSEGTPPRSKRTRARHHPSPKHGSCTPKLKKRKVSDIDDFIESHFANQKNLKVYKRKVPKSSHGLVVSTGSVSKVHVGDGSGTSLCPAEEKCASGLNGGASASPSSIMDDVASRSSVITPPSTLSTPVSMMVKHSFSISVSASSVTLPITSTTTETLEATTSLTTVSTVCEVSERLQDDMECFILNRTTSSPTSQTRSPPHPSVIRCMDKRQSDRNKAELSSGEKLGDDLEGEDSSFGLCTSVLHRIEKKVSSTEQNGFDRSDSEGEAEPSSSPDIEAVGDQCTASQELITVEENQDTSKPDDVPKCEDSKCEVSKEEAPEIIECGRFASTTLGDDNQQNSLHLNRRRSWRRTIPSLQLHLGTFSGLPSPGRGRLQSV